jgi:hypothetical protein
MHKMKNRKYTHYIAATLLMLILGLVIGFISFGLAWVSNDYPAGDIFLFFTIILSPILVTFISTWLFDIKWYYSPLILCIPVVVWVFQLTIKEAGHPDIAFFILFFMAPFGTLGAWLGFKKRLKNA